MQITLHDIVSLYALVDDISSQFLLLRLSIALLATYNIP